MLALVIVARDHVPITGHLAPAIQAPIIRLPSIVRTVAHIHTRAAPSTSTTSRADTASDTTTNGAAVDSRASQDGCMARDDDRARDGHAGALELRVYGARPAPDTAGAGATTGSGNGGRVR